MFDININKMVVVVMANIDAPATGLSSDCKVATGQITFYPLVLFDSKENIVSGVLTIVL